ncbi:hypothetical protein Q8A67_010980 [Cirrhinus molitorella]|uniref:Spermatogenesis associated 48 n=1 Tax=Cirrhinus molitorella TaxID=172907 RepID=A0AA88PTB7_9TELE|nr:hypothetical protein Q8A67_010980 [Cirrhinus molitorella]
MEEEREPYRVRLLKAPCESSEGVSRWLCRRMNLPCGKGPEGRYDFESMVETDRSAFSKFNRGAQPPDERAPLAPLRGDVSLIDPCSGQLSAGAQVHLEAKSRTPFIDTVYTASDLWVPAGVRDRPQTPPTRPSALIYDMSEHKRAYEDVDWDSKLPPRNKPPTTTLEKMADPVSQHFVLKRYHSRPELWQAIGSHWNKHQLRATFNARKPISFTSPCPKSGHIPLYCGTVGSENMDSVDVPGEDFIPLTILRTTIPPPTPASYRTTIPGYTGKARFDRPQTSGVSLPSLPYTPQTTGMCNVKLIFFKLLHVPLLSVSALDLQLFNALQHVALAGESESDRHYREQNQPSSALPPSVCNSKTSSAFRMSRNEASAA